MKVLETGKATYEIKSTVFKKLVASGAINIANAAGVGILNPNHPFTQDEVLLLIGEDDEYEDKDDEPEVEEDDESEFIGDESEFTGVSG